ncbi:hypothetical protein N0V93_009704 [Gnomoniopsis smithogilvyi]|uniref:Ribosome quality control complex subunit 2 n=1 Tax=Gnomoniopsis smithogilvyi TaxID=1191159 RepID=A0A9W8YLJ5_9PEZI|nr:hypothetical protein N0V93_009704 [Gnomoniopsis smithogilvyi]
MKQRFSSLDVKVTAHELAQSLIGLRLANIYDISSKKLLLKFAVSGKKEQLMIDSGFRTHLTDFTRATAAAPSAFTARLRKFLKTRRCTSITQIGTDRIIELQFSDGAYHMFLEFFAAGNVILTDADYKILAILRNVSEGEGQESQRIGSIYSLENRQNYGGVPALTRDRVRNALEITVKRAEATEGSNKKKQKRKPGDELRRGLATTLEEFPPIVVDHAFAVTGFEPTSKPADVLENETLFESLFHALEEARKIVDDVTSSATCKGYIIAKRRESKEETAAAPQEDKPQSLLYEDFQPFLPRRYETDAEYTILTYDNFNKTIDEFFSSLEGQKLEGRLNDREEAAKRKLEAVKQIQEQKVEGLKQAQILNMRKAGALEANVDRVSEAMDAVNGLISQGMDWVNIGKLIEREQKRKNPVAEIIKLPLNLEQNTITLLLAEEDAEENYADGIDETSSGEESDAETEDKGKTTDTRLSIEINLGLTPFANAREYYDQKKVAAVKAQKTVEHSVTALKNAEKKIAQDLKKNLKGEKPTLQLTRRQMWFEKFLWFISSDGYLVIGGRDAGTNEVLYKKHLRKGDIYVHADMHGASSVIIKNNPKTPDAPIPPSTLAQAGSLSVCSSNAWDSKAGMGAWWVHADQVSKSAPTGEYLPTGSFMVRGTKNILTPQPLVMGFGFMFKISEETKAHHVKHRLQEADDAEMDRFIGKSADTSKAGAVEEELLTAADVKSSVGDLEGPKDDGDNAGQDSEDGDSEHEQDDTEGSQRQNPLQVTTNLEEGEETESEQDEVEDVDGETDHVKDDLEKLSIGDSAEAMMSGALELDASNGVGAAEEQDAKGSEESLNADDSEDEDSETATEAPTEAPSVSTATASHQASGANPKSGPNKRGRRAKQKKIAAKYKYQDEEDRAMHEQLIGAAKGREKAEAEAKAKAEKQAEEEARRERRKQAIERQKKKLAEHEEVRRLMLDEGLEVLDDEEEASATPLDALVGWPFVGDEIMEIIPMCAPWAAMGKLKYKVKIQPGNTKKGKAIKEILERWKIAAGGKGNVDETVRDRERMWPREVELIKAVKPEEAHNVVPVGKVTVVMSGGKSGGGGGRGGKGGGKGGRGGKGSKKK